MSAIGLNYIVGILNHISITEYIDILQSQDHNKKWFESYDFDNMRTIFVYEADYDDNIFLTLYQAIAILDQFNQSSIPCKYCGYASFSDTRCLICYKNELQISRSRLQFPFAETYDEPIEPTDDVDLFIDGSAITLSIPKLNEILECRDDPVLLHKLSIGTSAYRKYQKALEKKKEKDAVAGLKKFF